MLTVRQAITEMKKLPTNQLSPSQISWLNDVANHYKIRLDDINTHYFDTLLNRVDYIPPSLVLTQAANETN